MLQEKAFSKEKPLEIEPVGHDRYLLRKNITESVNDNGKIYYTYKEQLIDKTAKVIIEAVNDKEARREADILDEYTNRLIEEGLL